MSIKRALTREIILGNPILLFYSLKAPGGRPIKPFLHQAHLLYHAVVARPVRLLIADEIGLGKTIEALAIARYLELNGEVKRILVLVPKILQDQWVSEIKRVGGKARLIKSGRELKRKLRISTEGYTVVSIDLAKREDHMEELLKVDWDLVIADEAHNITFSTQRYSLLEELAKRVEHLLLLSATPHRGDSKDYIARLRLVDPTLISDFRKLDKPGFYRKTHDTIVFRRTKRVVNELEGEAIFKKCEFKALVVDITDEERDFFDRLEDALHKMIEGSEKYSPRALLAVLLRKRASSSIQAAIKTLTKIAGTANVSEGFSHEGVITDIKRLFAMSFDEIELEENEDEIDDIINSVLKKYSGALSEGQRIALQEILRLAGKAVQKDSKLEAVAKIVAEHLRRGEKIVVFTEYVDTLEYLKENLLKYLEKQGVSLSEREVLTLSGKNRGDIEEINKRFEREATILLSTDVASEGLNLQVASVLINYEAPWSPVKLEQRIGRIWRLGQEKDTVAYTVFLANDMDLDVLYNLYDKIMTIDKDTKSVRPLLGREVYVASAISEYELVLASLKGQLSSYITAIIRTISTLARKLERNRVLPVMKAEEIKNELLSVLMDEKWLDRKKIEALLEEHGMQVLGVLDPRALQTQFNAILKNSVELPPRVLLQSKEDTRKKEYLFFAVVKDNNGNVLYKYPVLVTERRSKPSLKSGLDVLEYFKEILKGDVIPASKPKQTSLLLGIEGSIKNLVWNAFYRTIIKKYSSYENSLGVLKGGKLFRDTRIDVELATVLEYLPQEEFRLAKRMPIEILDILGLPKEKIAFPSDVDVNVSERNFVPLEDILKAEKRAMEVVMGMERKRLARKYGYEEKGRKWKVEDVSLKEHYDVRVVENGEERYIEVKGHMALLPVAELTSAERAFAERNKDKYWIYIVCNLRAGVPVIFKVFRPFNEAKRRIFLVKDGVDIDITDKVNINITTKDRF
ncbi:helicase-related protein, partial [Thermococcus sp.]|uniref:helicase-related protein n=1 Tax=Thermococcus sp. TaxID=35749 RepID=UPI002624BD65